MISLTSKYFFSEFFPFSSLKSRYNKFSDTYLVKVDDSLSVELPPLLTTSLYTYQNNNDVYDTINALKSFREDWESPYDDYSYIRWINSLYQDVEFEKSTPIWEGTPFQVRKVMDFSFFNRFLELLVPFRFLILLLSIILIIEFWSSSGSAIILELLTNKRVLYERIYLILPMFYFSRVLFTPLHEFGHNFWYYMFRKESGVFFINIKGFMRFQGTTDLPDLLYLPATYQRVLVSLGGNWAEVFILTLFFLVFPTIQLTFFGLVISLRVFLSVFWNMNLLSSHSDGHKMVADVIGFPTLGDCYNEYLISKVTRIPLKESLFNNRVLKTIKLYIIFALIFVGLLSILQINYFGKIFLRLTNPVFFEEEITVLKVILLLISYLYFFDFIVFGIKRIMVYGKLISRRKNISSLV